MQAVAPYGRTAIGLAAAGRARGQLPPLASVVGLPFGLDLAATSLPLARGLGRGLVVGGKPWLAAPPPHWLRAGLGRRSYISVFQIRMEKMKEGKHPPLKRYPHAGSLWRNSSNLICNSYAKEGRRIGGGG
ncbi:hypothetical protein BHE74_00045009 [Ensete ventricosum]|nr:hypothetical protein BHE74_00045009 [Ensete ventricosum]